METMTEMDTADVIAAMLTENTGRHMLDSGRAYGRNWERNAGKTAADFRAQPDITPVTFQRDGNTVVEFVTLDTFHFLVERLSYDADLDAVFHAYAMEPERADESWFACLDEWLDAIGATWEGSDRPITVNTYNGEDCLSQTLQYVLFDHPETEERMVALTIHGGCVVRGGYTAPRMFSLPTYSEYAMFDKADFTIMLREPEPVIDPNQGTLLDIPVRPARHVYIDVRGGYPDRNPEPWDDKSLDAIDFSFGETPVEVNTDGVFVIADGPATGWTVEFYPPISG